MSLTGEKSSVARARIVRSRNRRDGRGFRTIRDIAASPHHLEESCEATTAPHGPSIADASAAAANRPWEYLPGTCPRTFNCGERRDGDHRQFGAVVVAASVTRVGIGDIEFAGVLGGIGIGQTCIRVRCSRSGGKLGMADHKDFRKHVLPMMADCNRQRRTTSSTVSGCRANQITLPCAENSRARF